MAAANSGTAGLDQNGPIGGFQIGYNWQFSPLIVFGLEADIQGADISGHGETGSSATERFAGTSTGFTTPGINLQAAFTNPAITASGIDSVTSDVRWLGTVRARLGYLVTPNLLLYATGGVAYGGVRADDSLSTNFNLTADEFVLAFAQATGGPSQATQTSITTGPTPTASAAANTANTTAQASVTTTLASATALGGTTSETTATSVHGGTSVALANASTTTESTTSFAQISKPLSVAVAQTAQNFARVSDTKFGGTIGGGIEWMMAPNWSVKAEALYYNLGSVTVTSTSTVSFNPITAAIPATIGGAGGVSTAGVTSAINKSTGAATVSNATSTHVNFQGVILRVGLNYHFNLL